MTNWVCLSFLWLKHRAIGLWTLRPRSVAPLWHRACVSAVVWLPESGRDPEIENLPSKLSALYHVTTLLPSDCEHWAQEPSHSCSSELASYWWARVKRLCLGRCLSLSSSVSQNMQNVSKVGLLAVSSGYIRSQICLSIMPPFCS